jgi:hypothetical protein
MGNYEVELYREDVGILSEDEARTDINPYFEEDEGPDLQEDE